MHLAESINLTVVPREAKQAAGLKREGVYQYGYPDIVCRR